MIESRAELTDNLRAALPVETHEAFDELMGAFEDRIEKLEHDLVRAEDDVAERDDMESALEAVRYWFLDVLVHGRRTSDPRVVLRAVERALAP